MADGPLSSSPAGSGLPGADISATLGNVFDGQGEKFTIGRAALELGEQLFGGGDYSHHDASTNQAKNFFSRIRRAEVGMHHHIAGP